MKRPLVCPQNVGTTQAQFDLLQSFTEVTQSSETIQSEARTTWAGLSCGYCNKTFKTNGGLNRHVSLVRMSTTNTAINITVLCITVCPSLCVLCSSFVCPDALSFITVPLPVQLLCLRPLLPSSLLTPHPPALPHT